MVKLSLNAYLHTLISFWNEVHLICERLGLPSDLVGRLCAEDPRVPAYGALQHGEPVGGRCLPKDLAQLIGVAQETQYSPDLLLAARLLNQKVANAKPAGPAPPRADPAVQPARQGPSTL
jgi:UDP-glucose 6-dehydrogenase